MKEYTREYPLFSLCGLNCGLCPHYHTDGISRCPGCGGTDFHLKHPTCSIISCNKRHDNAEFCFQCSLYPCKKYLETSKTDSFISYQNVLSDFTRAEKEGLNQYKADMNRKIEFLEFLINNYNDGRRKSFYCLAVNLLALEDLLVIKGTIDREISNEDTDKKTKIEKIIQLFEAMAKEKGIDLKLRKNCNAAYTIKPENQKI